MQVTKRQLQTIARDGSVIVWGLKPFGYTIGTRQIALHTGVTAGDDPFRGRVVEEDYRLVAGLTEEDVAQGGHGSREEWAKWFLESQGFGWVAGFAWKTAEDEHPGTKVWYVKVKRVEDERPKLLAGFGKMGYVSTPGQGMPHEPECVGADVLRGYTKVAHEKIVAEREATEARLDSLSVTERLEEALREAERAGVDTSHYIESVLKRIKSLEGRTRRAASALAAA